MNDLQEKFNAFHEKAVSCVQAGNFGEAAQNWEKALEIDPSNEELKQNLCVAYYNNAVKWLTFNPDYPNYRTAYSCIKATLEYKPNDADAINMRIEIEKKLRETGYAFSIK
jgi:tetratricopeptide (TPR) repeat protein